MTLFGHEYSIVYIDLPYKHVSRRLHHHMNMYHFINIQLFEYM